MQIDPNVNVSKDPKELNRVIDDLNKELDKLIKDVNHFKEKPAVQINLNGSIEDIEMFYQISKAAQEKANVSELLNISESIREKASALFDNATFTDNDKLNELKQNTESLDLRVANNLICGAQGNLSCDNDPCGGALCHNEAGNKRCGGPNCNSSLFMASDAKKRAEETNDQMAQLLNKLHYTIHKIDSIRNITLETKEKATKLSDQLAKTKDELEKDKEETKDIIRKVKEFLTADDVSSEDLEAIANYVLSIKIPITPEEVKNKSKQIQDILSEIKGIDKELERLNNRSQEARMLLNRALKTEKAAQEIPSPAEVLKELDKVKKVQLKVVDTLRKITSDLNNSKTKLSQFDDKIKSISDNLMHVMNNIRTFQNEIEELKNKTQNNKISTEKAMENANEAWIHANEAEQDFNAMNEMYGKLTKLKIQEIPVDGKQKAEQLQQEANDLVKDLEGKMRRITELEKKIKDGNRKLKEKSDYLFELESNVTSIKEFIDDKISFYNKCQA